MSVSCEVCYEAYACHPSSRQPRLLPNCGHDFCTSCILKLCDNDSPVCPKCRLPLLKLGSSESVVGGTDSPVPSEGGEALAESGGGGASASSSNTNGAISTSGSKSPRIIRGSVNDFPILRCLLELEERLDIQLSQTPLMVQRAVEKAPTFLLRLEMDNRQRRELLEQLSTEALVQEVESRRKQGRQQQQQSLDQIRALRNPMTTNPASSTAVPLGLGSGLGTSAAAQQFLRRTEQRMYMDALFWEQAVVSQSLQTPRWMQVPSDFVFSPVFGPQSIGSSLSGNGPVYIDPDTHASSTPELSVVSSSGSSASSISFFEWWSVVLHFLLATFVRLFKLAFWTIKLPFHFFGSITREQWLQLSMLLQGLPLIVWGIYLFLTRTA